jgi:hypothetical protein
VGDAAEDATPPVEAAAQQDRAQAASDAATVGGAAEAPDVAVPVPPTIPDDSAAARVREIQSGGFDTAADLRSAQPRPSQVIEVFDAELRRGSPLATAAHAEVKRRAWGAAEPGEPGEHPVAVALHCCLATANTLEEGAREKESGLAKIEANRRLSNEAKSEDREKLCAENREKFGRSSEAFCAKAQKVLHMEEERCRSKLEQLMNEEDATPIDEVREGLDAILYLLAAGGGQDDKRMDKVIHAVAFRSPRLGARLLEVFSATASDPLRLEATTRSLRGRMAALQRTDILQDEACRNLAAELHLLGRARRAVDQIQEQAKHRPEEVSLLRQAIDRLWADLRR